MTTPVLIRQDTGETLVLDGLVRLGYAPTLRVPTHRTERRRDVVDDVSEDVPALSLSVVFSETPTVAGLPSGVERLQQVRAFLEGVRDALLDGDLALLTYDDGRDDPRTNLILQAWPSERAILLNERYNFTLRESRIARVTTVDIGEQGATSDNARPDVAASRAGEDDRGNVASRELRALQMLGVVN
jgi:hypothetical protein